MPGKRVQFDDETWQAIRLLATDTMKDFQELADEAFADLLKKHKRPRNLQEALRQSARQAAANENASPRSRSAPGRRKRRSGSTR